MKTALRLCVLGMVCFSMASCSSDKTGAALRKEGYDAILKNIKPGMYRRQLYALLPPMQKPTAFPPQLTYSNLVGPTFYSEHREEHLLDEECSLEVRYQLRNGEEYANPRHPQDQPLRRPRLNGKPKPITPDSIDDLLNASAAVTPNNPYKAGPLPSRENPDDIIVSISQTQVHAAPGSPMAFGAVLYPTQETMKFGRAMPPIKPHKGDTIDELLAPFPKP